MKYLILFILISTSNTVFTQNIKIKNLKKHIYYLADDQMKGRGTGSDENLKTAQYISKQFKKYGLKFNQKPNYGIYISGPETGKRKCLVDNIFKNLNVSDMYFDFLDTYFNSPDYEIIQILREYAIMVSKIKEFLAEPLELKDAIKSLEKIFLNGQK